MKKKIFLIKDWLLVSRTAMQRGLVIKLTFVILDTEKNHQCSSGLVVCCEEHQNPKLLDKWLSMFLLLDILVTITLFTFMSGHVYTGSFIWLTAFTNWNISLSVCEPQSGLTASTDSLNDRIKGCHDSGHTSLRGCGTVTDRLTSRVSRDGAVWRGRLGHTQTCLFSNKRKVALERSVDEVKWMLLLSIQDPSAAIM